MPFCWVHLATSVCERWQRWPTCQSVTLKRLSTSLLVVRTRYGMTYSVIQSIQSIKTYSIV